MKTRQLEEILKTATSLEKDQIIKQLNEINFTDYVYALLDEKQLDKSQVIKDSLIPRTYAYQIFQGSKQPGRDKVIQLAFAMKLNLEELNRLLTVAHHNYLYAKQQRDAIMIFAISNQYDLMQTNELLEEFHHELLGDVS